MDGQTKQRINAPGHFMVMTYHYNHKSGNEFDSQLPFNCRQVLFSDAKTVNKHCTVKYGITSVTTASIVFHNGG